MAQRTIAQRVESLELRMDRLEELPDRVERVETQILQLRQEMREQFSTVHAKIDAKIDGLKTHMLVLHEKLVADLATIKEGQPPRRRRQ